MAENYLYAGSWLDDSGKAGGGIHRYQIKENTDTKQMHGQNCMERLTIGQIKNQTAYDRNAAGKCHSKRQYHRYNPFK